MGVAHPDPVSQLSLPPGFRFYPTDEELLIHYLCRKVAGYHFSLQIIRDIDLYKFDPWDLPSKAVFGEKEWYFFSPRDRKYPNGSRPNRVAGSGYWKATGTDKIITTDGQKVGIKKALVFYVGKAPRGAKTNWIMHEYRLSQHARKNGSSRLDEWVLCRIYKKSSSSQKPVLHVSLKEQSGGSPTSSSSHIDDALESLPEIDDRFFALPRMSSLKNFLQDNQLNFQLPSSDKFDSCCSMPELVCNDHHAQAQVRRPTNDPYFPSVPPACHAEASSEKLRTQRVDNSGLHQQFPNTLIRLDSLDPFGIGYPTPLDSGGFGYLY